MMHRGPGWSMIRNILIKATVLFVLLNLVFALVYPRDFLGSISAYNWLFPGRLRFPHSDVPEKAFNITTANLEAMFHSHTIEAARPTEFRVVILGDSSVWGFLLSPEETLSSRLNQMNMLSPDESPVRFFNLGYPTLSVTKDLLLLEVALRYEPDLIVWFVTLESVVDRTQFESPLLELNPLRVQNLTQTYGLHLPGGDSSFEQPSFWERTIIGSRQELAELIRLQLYGVAWAATGVDHYIPETYNERMEDLSSDLEYKDYRPGEMTSANLSFDVIESGMEMAGEVPVLLINEPVFISEGENSEVRYNFFYPRWAYDEYRMALHEKSLQSDWQLVDIWDAIPAAEFTDSAIHYSAAANRQVAEMVASVFRSGFGFKGGVP